MNGEKPLSTPDVTKVQALVAAVGGVIAAGMTVINLFGWYAISGEQALAVGGLWTALGAVLVVSDAMIRNGRARALLMPPKGVVEDDKPKTRPRTPAATRRRGR